MRCDAGAFSRLYETVYKDLYRFALCLMKHPQDAEDVVSEAVILAYENIRSLKNEKAFKNWIFTILANRCKKKLMAVKPKETGYEGAEAAVEPDFGLPLDVRTAFDLLSEEERTIVALSVFGGYNSTEIGQLEGLNANTVRSKRSRALGKMNQILA